MLASRTDYPDAFAIAEEVTVVGENTRRPDIVLYVNGIALGVLEDWEWTKEIVELGPGDLLLIYTDGVTEAKDPRGGFFGPQRLLEAARAQLGRPAHVVQEALLTDVHTFVGSAPQFDDITLMLALREDQTGDRMAGIDHRRGR